MNIRFAVLAILSFIVIASAYSAYATYQPPTTSEKTITTSEYTHTGTFNYVVYLKNNTVYNTSILYPGQGNIFKKITDHINASLTYRFFCDQLADIDGTYELNAEIQTSIWTKEYTIIPQTAFSSTNGKTASFNTNFPINYTHFEDIVAAIDEETGVNAGDTALIMKCNIDITAEINNGSISESFTPSLNVSLGGNIIEIKGDISQYQTGFLEETQEVSQSEAIGQRNNWTAATIIFFIIFIVFTVFTTTEEIPTKDIAARQLKKIKKKYGEWIVETEKLPTTKDAKIIPMKTLDDLIKISEELGKPVIHTTIDRKHTFCVFDDQMHYQYVLPNSGKLKKTTLCPKCQTKITCEGTLGQKIHVVCPACGAKGIIAFGKTNPIERLISFKKR